MGSGKGRSRRVKASATAEKQSAAKMWGDFIQDHGLAGENLAEYYLNNPSFPLTRSDEILLLNEILADMRDLGAIEFGSGIDIDQIEIGTERDYGAEAIVMREKGSSDYAIIFSDGRARMPEIAPDTAISSLNATHLAQCVRKASQELDKSWLDHMKEYGHPPRRAPGAQTSSI